MKTQGVYLAFDLGATSWRAMLADNRSGKESHEEIYRSVNQPQKTEHGLFWDVEQIFSDMKNVIRDVTARGIQLDAIGIDSWNVDFALLDDAGQILELPHCYRDPRNDGMLNHLAELTDLNEVFNRTGTMAEDITTLCQLLAVKRDASDMLAKARRLLFIPDLLRYWLCGQIATDYTLATTSQLYHWNNRQWDFDLITRLGLPTNILPPIRYGCSILGRLDETIQWQTGQRAVPIITGASHDTAAAFFAANADFDSVVISSGTWSVIGVNLPARLSDAAVNCREFGYEGNVDGTIRLIQNVPGMYLLEQVRKDWPSVEKGLTHQQVIAQARQCDSFKTSIDPFWPGFNNPDSMAQAISQYCKQTNQTEPKRPGEYARAIFAGLAAVYAKVITQLRTLTGRKYQTLVVVGGGSQNDLLNELTEKAAGVKVIRGPIEASAVGNIRSQQLALENKNK